MGITRTIIFAAVLILCVLLIKRIMGDRKKYNESRQQMLKAKVADMKQCTVCGVHIPEKDIIMKDNKIYCSLAHSNQNNSTE